MKIHPYSSTTTYVIPVAAEGPDEIINVKGRSLSPKRVKLSVDTDENGVDLWTAWVLGEDPIGPLDDTRRSSVGSATTLVYSSTTLSDFPHWLRLLIAQVTG